VIEKIAGDLCRQLGSARGLARRASVPPDALWDEEELASSRLLAYEVWNRINAHGLMIPLGGRASGLLARVSLTEMSERVLARALQPFPVAVRTLDALHLATIEFLRSEGRGRAAGQL
jgi:hypothetical protein